MRRRTFLELTSAAATGTVLGSLAGCAQSAPMMGWAWVHGGAQGDRSDWRRRFEPLAGAGVHGVLVSGGDMEVLGDAAHAAGLTFHRWMWMLNRNGDDWAQTNHPEWFSVSRNGDSTLTTPPYVAYYRWVCPTRQPVRDYLSGLVDEVARHPVVDGVHLDYIRYPDVILPRGLWDKYGLVQDREFPEFDFCYCDVCRPTFQALTGDDPLLLPDPTQDVRWREFRWDSVTATVKELSDAVRARGKQISAAVFPTPTIARQLVRQAWEQWALDAVFPMLYHGFYEEEIPWIASSTALGVKALPAAEPLYAGLYLPDLGPVDLGAAIDAARQGGARGVSLFEMGGLSEAHLEVLADRLRVG